MIGLGVDEYALDRGVVYVIEVKEDEASVEAEELESAEGMRAISEGFVLRRFGGEGLTGTPTSEAGEMPRDDIDHGLPIAWENCSGMRSGATGTWPRLLFACRRC